MPSSGESEAAEKRVLIAYRYVPQYREAFYNALRRRLARANVRLDLVYGDPSDEDAKKRDAVVLPWARHIRNRFLRLGQRHLIYQPIVRLALKYDLVIVEQANRLLANVALLAMNKVGLARVAFWGHGKNFQAEDGSLARSVKRVMLPQVCWWFAYNELSASIVRDGGFPDEKITRVQNAIDNEAFRMELRSISDDELQRLRTALDLRGDNVCIFIGGMYGNKRLPFLFAACELIRRQIPDFEMMFVGDGIDGHLVERFAARHDWVKMCGPAFGHAKAVHLGLAKLILMPGLVGLVIIDAFAAAVPIVTTAISFHSPEIDYLIDGSNGVMVAPSDDVAAYADRVAALLRDDALRAHLRIGCAVAAERYTMTAMVENFAQGIFQALADRSATTRRRRLIG